MNLVYQIFEEVPVITFSSENGENRLGTKNLLALSKMLKRIEEEGHLCVILTGGDDNFCMGGDLGDLSAMCYAEIEEFGRVFSDTLLAMQRCGIVIIAAIKGSVFGGGINLVDASDLAVAAQNSLFAIPEVAGGLPPVISYVGMHRNVNRKLANELAFSSLPIVAEEALKWGLLNRVVDKEQVFFEALELAKQVRHAGAFCVHEIKTLSVRMDGGRLEMQLKAAADRLSGIMLHRRA